MSRATQIYIQTKLDERLQNGNLRSLSHSDGLTDFYSNDYLGFARDAKLHEAILKEISNNHLTTGSTGSRLLSGNIEYAEALETHIATFHQAAAALLFNSGFDANYGLLSSLPYKGHTIFYDALVHASIHDGIRNSKANSRLFEHNSVAQLRQLLANTQGLKFVVVESVYSMDGDMAPLNQLCDLCDEFDASLIVDEAHATGLYGPNGGGLAQQLGVQDRCFARIYTYGKAMGCHGAAVVGSELLKSFLVNYCRPFIYSTALPGHSLAAIKCAYNYLPHAHVQRTLLSELIEVFRGEAHSFSSFKLIDSHTVIQSIVVDRNNVKPLASFIRSNGLDVRAIMSPTVPKGSERIRICLHSFNTRQEVINLVSAIKEYETQVA